MKTGDQSNSSEDENSIFTLNFSRRQKSRTEAALIAEPAEKI